MDAHLDDIPFILNELGEERNQYFGAVSPPIIQTSNYGFLTVEDLRRAHKSELNTFFYGRPMNPVTEMLAKKVAALEGAEAACTFATGMGAISGAVMAFLKAGDHALCVQSVYHHTHNLFAYYLPRFGVETDFFDGSNTEALESAIKPNTKLIYLESPTSYTFKLQDLAAITQIAKQRSIITLIDNTYATPIFQQPIQLGVDLSVHSATKYLGGHSDAMGGVVCGATALIEQIKTTELLTIGAVMAPQNAWLILRGMRTLEVRMRYIDGVTRKLVTWLAERKEIRKINYPFLHNNPQLSLAKKQMSGCGGLFSIELYEQNIEKVEAFCNRLKRFLMAASWGGHESLQFPACVTLPEGTTQHPLVGFIRFYVGLDTFENLRNDFEQAFEGLK